MAGITTPHRPLPSPSSPSPFPLPLATPSDAQGWHFPGPSSKYHKREQARRHARFGSTHSTSAAPVLSTERRAAHRRTRSSVPLSGTAAQCTSPTSEHSRSPLDRFPSHAAPYMANVLPRTPVKSPAQMPADARVQGSPFSDYFTDDARSMSLPNYTPGGARYNAPSSDMQQVLVRLSRLQSQLMRNGTDEQETLDIVRTRLDDIEADLNALRSRTPLAEGNALVLDDERKTNGLAVAPPAGMDTVKGPDGVADRPQPVDKADRQRTERDDQLAEAQRVLENVTKAQAELQKRHSEVLERSNEQLVQLEEREYEIERLRSQNEALTSDLGFDHSELLFLKLQMNSLEVDMEDLALRLPKADSRARATQAKGREVIQEMNRWRDDWHDIDARFRRRRGRYDPLPADAFDDDLDADLDIRENMEDGDWKLETVRHGHGRLFSITLRRLETNGDALGRDESVDRGADAAVPRTPPTHIRGSGASRDVSPLAAPSVTNQGCQTAAEVPVIPSERADHGTQTDLSLQPRGDAYSAPYAAEIGARERSDEPGDAYTDDECAITTSPTSAAPSPVTRPQRPPPPHQRQQPKGAWAELWEGLGHLAGMALDD